MITTLACWALIGPTVGLKVGQMVSPFEPMHVSGPFKGIRQCPVCEWGALPMVFIWNNGGDPVFLEKAAQSVQQNVAGTKIKAFFVDANASGNDKSTINALTDWSTKWSTPNVYFMVRNADLKVTLKNYALQDLKAWKTAIYTVQDRKVTQAWIDAKEDALTEVAKAIQALKSE